MSQQTQVRDLSAILDISKAMVAIRDLDELLNFIIQKATEILEAERSSIFLVDYDTQELWSRVAQLDEVVDIRFPWDKGIAGYVVQHREVLNIKDAYQDLCFNPEIDKKTGYQTRTILCAPLLNHKDEVTGVLQAINKKQGVFTDYDEALIMALSAQSAIAVENAQLYEELELTFQSFLKTLASVIDSRDPVTAGHSEQLARYALNIGRALGMSEQELKILDYAAALHDIGKIGVRDDVLLKPGKLTPEEYEQMKRHAIKTKEIVENMFLSRELRDLPHIAASHHEKLNGSGYPLGLKGDQISKTARILVIADIFDALVAYDRPYKRALSIEEAMRILEEGKGTLFDAEIIEVFKNQQLYQIERRAYPRLKLTIPFEYLLQTEKKQIDETLQSAETQTISAGGMLFVSKKLLPLGSSLNLVLQLPSIKMHLKGKVIRCDKKLPQGYYIGVKFLNLTNEESEKLASLLKEVNRANE